MFCTRAVSCRSPVMPLMRAWTCVSWSDSCTAALTVWKVAKAPAACSAILRSAPAAPPAFCISCMIFRSGDVALSTISNTSWIPATSSPPYFLFRDFISFSAICQHSATSRSLMAATTLGGVPWFTKR